MIYDSINLDVLKRIPSSATRILDIGCGSGALGKSIKDTRKCEIVGITYSQDEADIAAHKLDRVVVENLNDIDFTALDLGSFDCVICSHVLEHLYVPEVLLEKLRDSLGCNFKLIVALPNTLNWRQRLIFLSGRFRYTEGGLMDKTHYRFFDWKTSSELLSSSGYQVLDAFAGGYFPLPYFRKIFGSFSRSIDTILVKRMPSLLGVQFVFVAQPLK